jgi:protein transport protein DSL1/ZW10
VYLASVHSVVPRQLNPPQHKFRAAKDRLEEQLSEAYSRSVTVLPSELVIRTAVQGQLNSSFPTSLYAYSPTLVRQSEVVLPLSSVLASASTASVSVHMSTLRRDLTSQYINQILQQPLSVEISATMDSEGTTENKLMLNSHTLNQENLTARLDNLSAVLTFLSIKLFPHLPPPHRDSFPKLLCQPIARSLLADLLILSLPSSFAELHVFLHLVENAVRFEDEYLIQLLGNAPGDRPIKEWADGVIGHYERKRRVDILEAIRSIVVNRGTTSASTFRVESIPVTHPEPLPVLPVESQPPPGTPKEAEDVPETDEDGWGFENDVEPEIRSAPGAGSNPRDEEDPADAWGWNEEDDSEPSDDSAAWDDPWNEPDADLQTSLSLPTRPEKVASKSTTRANGAQTSKTPLHDQTPLSAAPFPEPIKTFAAVSKETYLVSMRAKEVVTIVERVLDEATELSASKDLPRRLDSASPPGAVLLQSVISSLELFLALYPVTFSADMASHPERTMQFTNDCIYLSGETERIRAANVNIVGIVGKLNECGDIFKLWGESSFWDNVVRTGFLRSGIRLYSLQEVQCRSVDDTLSRVEGFTFTAEQDRYDECEGAINQVLNNIRSIARLWKVCRRSPWLDRIAHGRSASAT